LGRRGIEEMDERRERRRFGRLEESGEDVFVASDRGL